MSKEKKVVESKEVKKVLTEQELMMQAQRLHQERITKANNEIQKILKENNLTMHIEHVIKLVPSR